MKLIKSAVSAVMAIAMLFGSLSSLAFAEKEEIKRGDDWIIEDFNDSECIKNIKTDPETWGIDMSWVAPEDSGNGTGALKCDLNYAYATPTYYFNLVRGRTYKICTYIKTSMDLIPTEFNFWFSGQNNGEYVFDYEMVNVKGLEFKKDRWVKIESQFTWDGVIGRTAVEDKDVRIAFRIGSGLFEDLTGDHDVTYSYCMDDFTLTPWIDEDYESEESIGCVKTDPETWGINLSRVSPNESGNGTGALMCELTYAYATPRYKVNLEQGKTYKLSVYLKPSMDWLSDTFNFWLSGEMAGKDVNDYQFLTVKNIEYKKDKWIRLEAIFKWQGIIGKTEVNDYNVGIGFRIGEGLFEKVTGDKDTAYSYCIDNFKLEEYIPECKTKISGECAVGNEIRIKTSYDFLYGGIYQSFDGFDSAVIDTLIDGKVIKTENAKCSTLKIIDDYAGKNISFNIYPTVYRKKQNMVSADAGIAYRKDNRYSVKFDSKTIDPEAEYLSGKTDHKIYDGTQPKNYIATFNDNTMQQVLTTDGGNFKIPIKNSTGIKTFVWDGMKPLTPKIERTKENSIKFYVDPVNGNDGGKGNFTSPFKTVARAKREVADIIEKNNNSAGKIKWHIEGSVLRISGTHEMPDYEIGNAPWETYRESIRTVIIDDGVKSIGSNAFNGFQNLKNVVLSKTVESIGESAFSDCDRLTAVAVPDSVANVGDNAFGENTSACVGKKSKYYGTYGFKSYTDGEDVSDYLSSSSDDKIGWGLYGDTLLIFGKGYMINDASYETIPWKNQSKSIKKAVVEYGVLNTPQFLFSGTDGNGKSNYENLKVYTVADTVIRLGCNEIGDCSGLEKLDMSSATNVIMHYVTGNALANKIKNLTVPKGITSIGGCAFNNLTSLEKLTFEEGFNANPNADSEWSGAFRNTSVKFVTFPKSMEEIKPYFISRAYEINKITILNKDAKLFDNCFYEINKNTVICGYADSTAETFAEKNGYVFEPIPDTSDLTPEKQDKEEKTGSIDKIYVMLMSGEHFIDKTLDFNYLDCDENIEVCYTTYGREKAVLTGGMKIEPDKWQLYDAQKGIYRAFVGTDVTSRQFFVNGVRAERARSKGGFANYSVDEKGYLCDNAELLNYAHPEDLELLIHVAWTTPRCGVSSVENENGRVRVNIKPETWKILWGRSLDSFQQCRPNNPYYYENAYELLDESGEWYLNSHDGYMYYKPRSFEDIKSSEAIIPVTEKLVSIEGTKYLNVQNITFDNVSFAYSTWLRPNGATGHCSNQNNTIWEGSMDDIFYPDGSVEVKCASNINFENCTFTKLGTIALKMFGGVHNCSVINNEFCDLSACAVMISDRYGEAQTTEDDAYVNRDIKIDNNFIHTVGVDFNDSAAITTGYVKNTEITHNEIFNTPYSGMHLGFVKDENYISGLVVKNNYIHNYMNKMTDGGGIYFFSATAGNDENKNVAEGNYVANGWHGVGSIVLDYDTSNIDFINNVTDETNNQNSIDSYAAEWSKGWIPYDFNAGDTNRNIYFSGNFGTNGYKISDTAKNQNCRAENNKICEFGIWDSTAKKIIKSAGLESDKLADMPDIPREIELENQISMNLGDERELEYTAFDAFGNIYNSSMLQVYCCSSDETKLTVKNDSVLCAVGSGETELKVVFKCGDELRVRNVSVTVK